MKIKATTTASDIQSDFVTQHATDVTGVLSGFDRLRLQFAAALPAQPYDALPDSSGRLPVEISREFAGGVKRKAAPSPGFDPPTQALWTEPNSCQRKVKESQKMKSQYLAIWPIVQV